MVEDGSLVGIVTDRDLREASPKVTTLSIHELNYLLSKLLVRDVVKGPPITVNADDPVEWAALLMAENRVSGLPVLLAGELTGILTITDLLRAFVIALGLREGGTRVTVDLPDTPGTLARVAEAGPPSNIVSVATGGVKPSRRRELILRVVGEGADAFATRLRERGWMSSTSAGDTSRPPPADRGRPRRSSRPHPFLEPDLADRILADLREAGVVYHRSGGYSGARRSVVTAYPAHMPVATTPLAAPVLPGGWGAGTAGGCGRSPGDRTWDRRRPRQPCRRRRTRLSRPPDGRLLEPVPVGGRQISGREIDLKLLRAAPVRRFDAVVPSLRVDAVGAKAFRVSRSFFRRGIEAGNVMVNGSAVGKAAAVKEADEVYAAGLGRFRVVALLGETRRGNLKITLEVERATV